MAVLVGLVLMAAGCGGSNSPGIAGGGGSSSGALANFGAYASCMRSHGIPDFPDPSTSPGGGVGIQIHGGPGSDLNRNDPRFMTAAKACRGLRPGGGQAPAPLSAQKIAAEVRWARCMRLHGLSGFPDPNSEGAFDSSKFDENAPTFQAASKACGSVQPTGPTPVVPGRG
ncbi:MAG TPA: hypothetical protein VH210_14655 [Gaiellaceae bacterium]|jgi:hypothetical protein|nr:hypothetical protein [Gaiellaceae bacterium]